MIPMLSLRIQVTTILYAALLALNGGVWPNCRRRCQSAKSTTTPRSNPLPHSPQQHLHQSR